ncbi:trypsin-like peptidase domain-containing protein [Acidovorax sp. 106]|uniref:trypsin-like peptidase domain-containing protein n=1 Tax=Acidovorax sp. 106 TaxID=2135637 RepID=UPI000F290E7C|nr:trypsin-like peptidase domain-containing protein [Acidovorax sp. 106]RLJ40153.1 hypothetical protein C8C98_3911 [Acidovorax sp. 106]
MFHGLNNQFLYAAYKISATFADAIGNTKTGVGTCFFVKNRHGALCLVTNRHVLDISYKKNNEKLSGYSLRRVEISGKSGRLGDNYPEDNIAFSLAPNVNFHPNPENDIACITQLVPINADAHIDYFIPATFIATLNDFKNKLSVCDFLAFPGFPEWHDKAASRPILRTGTISSDPRFDYSYGESVKGACVAYEAFSYSGSSGSPVFAVQKGPKPGTGIDFPGFRDLLFVGINAGHLKTRDNSHSGISYFYKATAISDVIDT